MSASEPTQADRVAQLQREREALRIALRVLVDAIDAGLHLTHRSPLVQQGLKALGEDGR